METSAIFFIGLILFMGYMAGLLANRFGLPKVSGYVLVGMLLSPTVTGILSVEFLESSSLAIDFALAMVAYDLGGNLRFSSLRKRGRQIVSITLGQGFGAYLFTAIGTFAFMVVFHKEFGIGEVVALSFVFGALALSTAPAATLATVHEYSAKGRFTSMLLAVVALDDAIALMAFALTVALVKSSLVGDGIDASSFLRPVLNIALSAGLGALMGFVLTWTLKFGRTKDYMMIFAVAFFCLTYGVAKELSLEPLFATMCLGVTVANVFPGKEPFVFLERNYEPVVFAVFFVLAGAHIDLGILLEYFPIALVFVVFRFAGKWTGSYAGGVVSHAPRGERLYMGLGLAPQAGIAIGLALYLNGIAAFDRFSAIAVNVVIANAAINEVIGPYLLKVALKRTGQIRKRP